MLFAGSVAVGLAIDAVVFRIIKSRALTQHWATGEALAHALHGLPTVTSIVVGVRLALPQLGLGDEATRIVFKSIEIAWILVATAFAARIAGRLIRAYTQREDARLPSSSIFVNLARGTVWVVGSLVLLGALGVSIAPLITALGVGGLAIGLALQPTLENLFSGVQVLLSGQVQPGDLVRLETGEEGRVQDVTWRNTTIRAFSNDLVIVPNATVAKSLITNYTTIDEQHVVWVNVGIAYGSELHHAEEVTLEVARQVHELLDCASKDYEPLLRYTEFGDSAIALIVSLRARAYNDRWVLRSEFMKLLHKRYAQEGIEIPFPQHVVHMHNAEETK